MIKQKIYLIYSIIVYSTGIILGMLSPQVRLNKINILHRLILPSILKNNLDSIMYSLSGAFSFGCSTAFNLLLNGMLLTLIIREELSSGLSVQALFLLVAPHGVFEIPAMIIAGAAGFKIPYEIVRYLMSKKEQPLTRERHKGILNASTDFNCSHRNCSIRRSLHNTKDCRSYAEERYLSKNYRCSKRTGKQIKSTY